MEYYRFWKRLCDGFKVKKEFMDKYKIERVGAQYHTEWWIPAEDLEELNNNIVGTIEVLEDEGT